MCPLTKLPLENKPKRCDVNFTYLAAIISFILAITVASKIKDIY